MIVPKKKDLQYFSFIINFILLYIFLSILLQVEWQYALDVHANAFFCSFFVTHVLQVRSTFFSSIFTDILYSTRKVILKKKFESQLEKLQRQKISCEFSIFVSVCVRKKIFNRRFDENVLFYFILISSFICCYEMFLLLMIDFISFFITCS